MTNHYTYVDSTESLGELIGRLGSSPRVALDTEGNSLYAYADRVCLIQLSIDEQDYLVDPLSDIDLSDFYRSLARCPLILHAADNDLRQLYKEAEFVPEAGLYDTLVGAQLLGGEHLSLAALVEEVSGVTLSKAGQKSNWGARPLSKDQLDYAVDDTRYLPRIAEEQERKLKDLGRWTWFEEWCERSSKCGVRITTRDPDDAWRIKGSGKLKRREMAFLRELWRWRDGLAAAANKPPFKILGNDQLLTWSRWGAENPERAVHRGPRLPRHVNGKRLDGFKGAFTKASRLSKDEWPQPRLRQSAPASSPTFKEDTDRLKKACHRITSALAIEPSVLAPRSTLEAIARARPDSREAILEASGLMNWQVDLLHEDILATFNGKAV